MKRTNMIALLLIGIVTATTTVAAFSFGNDETMNDELRSAVDEAVAENDYDAWKALVDERHAEMTSAEGFAMAQERRANRGQGNGERRGKGERRHFIDATVRDALDEALANNDYDAWKAIHEENDLPVVVEAEDFATLQALHHARQAGNIDLAATLSEELGMPGPGKHGGPRGGFGNGDRQRLAEN